MDHNRTLTVSETIDAPLSKVWHALTNKEMIKQYFFGTEVNTDWKPGSPITFTGQWEGQTYEDKGTILENQPEKCLKFNYWSSMGGLEDKPENYINITYQLEQDHEQTRLAVIQQGFRDQKAYEHSQQGWQLVLKGLKELVEK